MQIKTALDYSSNAAARVLMHIFAPSKHITSKDAPDHGILCPETGSLGTSILPIMRMEGLPHLSSDDYHLLRTIPRSFEDQ